MRFGRKPKSGSSGRHRSTPAARSGEPQVTDHELQSYLAAISPSGDPEMTDPGRPFGNARVYQLRLPRPAADMVQWLAEQRGTAPLSLLQSWVLERLQEESRRAGR